MGVVEQDCGEGRTLYIYEWTIAATGNLKAGLVLSKLLWWDAQVREHPTLNWRFLTRRPDGLWFGMSRAEFCMIFPLSPTEFDGAIRRLAAAGLLVAKAFKKNGTPVLHLQLVDEVVISARTEAVHDEPEQRPSENTDPHFHKTWTSYRTRSASIRFKNCDRKTDHGEYEKTANRKGLYDQSKVNSETLPDMDDLMRDARSELDRLLHRRAERLNTTHDLFTIWRSRLALLYPGELVPELTAKEVGQLAKLRRRLLASKGVDPAELLDIILQHWSHFVFQVKVQDGVSHVPSRPHIGFLLSHYAVAVNLTAPRTGDDLVTSPPMVDGTVPSLPAPVAVEKASLEEIEEAMREFGSDSVPHDDDAKPRP